MVSYRLTEGEVLVAQGKRRRSTEGAQGTNTGRENAEGMASVGVRLTDQLGSEPNTQMCQKIYLLDYGGSIFGLFVGYSEWNVN